MSSSRIYALIFAATGAVAVVAALVYYAPIDRVAAALVFAMGVGFFVGAREQWARLGRLEQQIASMRAMSPQAESTGDADLDAWVDVRTQGAHVSLAGASYAPFLVGLFVMLGLLGTFLGLFETLRGARFALTAASDPQAMREGLTAPMLGLTRSFGCSATGVTTSACLGLVGMVVRGRENALSAALQRLVARRLQGRNANARTESLLEALAGKFDTVANALSGMSLAMAGMGNSLDAGQKESLVRLEGSLTRHTEALGGLQATLTEGHARELSRMGDALLTHADKVASPLLLQGDKLFGQMDAALKSVVEAETRMTEALADATTKMTQLLASTSATIADTLASTSTAMTHTMASTNTTLSATLGNAQTQQASALAVHQAAHLAAQRDSTSALHAELGAAQALQQNALATATAAQLEALQSHLPQVLAPLESATQKMTQAALAHTERLQNASMGLGGAMQASATGVTDALASAATGVSVALAGTATSLTDTLAKASEALTALMNDSGARMSEALLQSHTMQQISIQNAATAQAVTLGDALAQQLAVLEQHGARMMAPLEGTALGIAEAVGGHAEALRNGILAVTMAAQEARSGDAVHVQTIRELVTVAREGLVSVKVGGAELEAAASMFAAAATAHQEGARAWLGSLDVMDERVRQSGKAAAAEALQKQLEYTHKIFGEQLRLHRELFEEVRGAQRVKEHLVAADTSADANAAGKKDGAHGV